MDIDRTYTRVFNQLKKSRNMEMTLFELTSKFEEDHKSLAKIITTNELAYLAKEAGINVRI